MGEKKDDQLFCIQIVETLSIVSNSRTHPGDNLSIGSLGPDADGFRVDLNVVDAADVLSLRGAALQSSSQQQVSTDVYRLSRQDSAHIFATDSWRHWFVINWQQHRVLLFDGCLKKYRIAVVKLVDLKLIQINKKKIIKKIEITILEIDLFYIL